MHYQNHLFEDFTYEPSKILDNTRAIVEERFIRSKDDIKDGMDISLCCLNEDNKTITWALGNESIVDC